MEKKELKDYGQELEAKKIEFQQAIIDAKKKIGLVEQEEKIDLTKPENVKELLEKVKALPEDSTNKEKISRLNEILENPDELFRIVYYQELLSGLKQSYRHAIQGYEWELTVFDSEEELKQKITLLQKAAQSWQENMDKKPDKSSADYQRFESYKDENEKDADLYRWVLAKKQGKIPDAINKKSEDLEKVSQQTKSDLQEKIPELKDINIEDEEKKSPDVDLEILEIEDTPVIDLRDSATRAEPEKEDDFDNASLFQNASEPSRKPSPPTIDAKKKEVNYWRIDANLETDQIEDALEKLETKYFTQIDNFKNLEKLLTDNQIQMDSLLIDLRVNNDQEIRQKDIIELKKLKLIQGKFLNPDLIVDLEEEIKNLSNQVENKINQNKLQNWLEELKKIQNKLEDLLNPAVPTDPKEEKLQLAVYKNKGRLLWQKMVKEKTAAIGVEIKKTLEAKSKAKKTPKKGATESVYEPLKKLFAERKELMMPTFFENKINALEVDYQKAGNIMFFKSTPNKKQKIIQNEVEDLIDIYSYIATCNKLPTFVRDPMEAKIDLGQFEKKEKSVEELKRDEENAKVLADVRKDIRGIMINEIKSIWKDILEEKRSLSSPVNINAVIARKTRQIQNTNDQNLIKTLSQDIDELKYILTAKDEDKKEKISQYLEKLENEERECLKAMENGRDALNKLNTIKGLNEILKNLELSLKNYPAYMDEEEYKKLKKQHEAVEWKINELNSQKNNQPVIKTKSRTIKINLLKEGDAPPPKKVKPLKKEKKLETEAGKKEIDTLSTEPQKLDWLTKIKNSDQLTDPFISDEMHFKELKKSFSQINEFSIPGIAKSTDKKEHVALAISKFMDPGKLGKSGLPAEYLLSNNEPLKQVLAFLIEEKVKSKLLSRLRHQKKALAYFNSHFLNNGQPKSMNELTADDRLLVLESISETVILSNQNALWLSDNQNVRLRLEQLLGQPALRSQSPATQALIKRLSEFGEDAESVLIDFIKEEKPADQPISAENLKIWRRLLNRLKLLQNKKTDLENLKKDQLKIQSKDDDKIRQFKSYRQELETEINHLRSVIEEQIDQPLPSQLHLLQELIEDEEEKYKEAEKAGQKINIHENKTIYSSEELLYMINESLEPETDEVKKRVKASYQTQEQISQYQDDSRLKALENQAILQTSNSASYYQLRKHSIGDILSSEDSGSINQMFSRFSKHKGELVWPPVFAKYVKARPEFKNLSYLAPDASLDDIHLLVTDGQLALSEIPTLVVLIEQIMSGQIPGGRDKISPHYRLLEVRNNLKNYYNQALIEHYGDDMQNAFIDNESEESKKILAELPPLTTLHKDFLSARKKTRTGDLQSQSRVSAQEHAQKLTGDNPLSLKEMKSLWQSHNTGLIGFRLLKRGWRKAVELFTKDDEDDNDDQDQSDNPQVVPLKKAA